MRTRACICTMLLAFCHVRMNAQALTMRLPPAIHAMQQKISAAPADTTLPDAPQDARNNPPIAVPVPPPLTGVPVTIHARQQSKHEDTYDLRGEVEIDYEDLPGVFDRDLDAPSAGVPLDDLRGGGGGIGGDQGQVVPAG